MTPRTEPPAVDVAARKPQRECRTVIGRPRWAIGASWRNVITTAVDSIALGDNRIAEYWIESRGHGLRLVVQSEAPHCAGELAREVKSRALTRCAS